jgi:hypothetical protein
VLGWDARELEEFAEVVSAAGDLATGEFSRLPAVAVVVKAGLGQMLTLAHT